MLLLELQIIISLKLNLHKLYQRTATSRIVSKMSLVELQMASSAQLNQNEVFLIQNVSTNGHFPKCRFWS